MKKIYGSPVAILTSNPFLKGIYIVIIMLTASLPSFGQVEQKKEDNSYYKWDVSFDLKPLLRKDETFNLQVRRYTSHNKAWRLGIGFNASKIPENKKENFDNSIFDSLVVFFSFKKINQLSTTFLIGRQFEKSRKALSIYTCSDLVFNLDVRKEIEGLVGAYGFDPVTGRYASNKRFTDTLSNYNILSLSFMQTLGFKYYFNKQISISTECNISFTASKVRTELDSQSVYTSINGQKLTGDFPFLNTESHWSFNTKLKPIAHIFLSYYF